MAVLKQRYQLMLLVSIVFAVFYPTLSAEICLVDDQGAILSALNDSFSLQAIFFPRSAAGGYYRPLVGLSYWLDKELWFLHEHLMHFEGVVAHLMNAILVYLVTRVALMLKDGARPGWAPLMAAFFFALHPVVTESVNWISGRTDLMMGNGVLLSALMLLCYRHTARYCYLLLGILSGIVAVLAKEAAFGYLMALPLLSGWFGKRDQGVIAELEGDHPQGNSRIWLLLLYYVVAVLVALYGGSYWFVAGICLLYLITILYREQQTSGTGYLRINLRGCLLLLFSCVAAGLLFVLLRKLAYTSSVPKIGQTVSLLFADTSYTISLFLGAIGFYLKKFIMPLPLSFFILEVDPLYDLLGIAVVLACMHLAISRKIYAQMAVTGFLLLLPALPFAFGTIAWTAYAERYIYLSTAFWVISIALVVHTGTINSRYAMPRAVILFILIAAAAYITYNRNTVWQTNVALMRDTMQQSPKQRKLRDLYIYALVSAGRLDQAEKEFRDALNLLPSIDADIRSGLMIGASMVKMGRYDDALKLYRELLSESRHDSEPLLKETVRLLWTMLNVNTISDSRKLYLTGLEREYAAKMYAISQDPLIFIEAGDRAIKAGAFSAASSSFDHALMLLPSGDRLRKGVENKIRQVRDAIDRN